MSAPETTFGEIAVRMALKAACELVGGQSEFARIHRLDQANVAAIINGRRSPGIKIARLLGFDRVIRYRKYSFASEACLPHLGNSPDHTGALSSS